MANPGTKQETISVSASVAAAFGSTANDTNIDVTKVGYVTKASEGLPFRVLCLGPVTDQYGNVMKDEDGNVSFGYIGDRPILENNSWHNSKDVLNKINRDRKFIEAGFGMTNFPTSKHGRTGTDMLGMIYRHKKELGITASWIHGEAASNYYSFFLNSGDGDQSKNSKGSHVAAFPAWSVKQPII